MRIAQPTTGFELWQRGSLLTAMLLPDTFRASLLLAVRLSSVRSACCDAAPARNSESPHACLRAWICCCTVDHLGRRVEWCRPHGLYPGRKTRGLARGNGVGI